MQKSEALTGEGTCMLVDSGMCHDTPEAVGVSGSSDKSTGFALNHVLNIRAQMIERIDAAHVLVSLKNGNWE